MKKILATIMTILSAGVIAARTTGVNVTAETMADNSLRFYAEVNGYGTFTVKLTIDNVFNADIAYNEKVIIKIINGDGEIFILPPMDASGPASAEFHWDWLQGEIDPTPDLGFVYRIPLAAGRTTKVRNMSPADAGIMHGNISNFRMWHFSSEENDTVFAIRKGVVIRIEGFESNGAFAARGGADGNIITIEHADGTHAVYSGLKNGSLMVREGDTVYPDTTIALAGKTDSGEKGVSVGLYYYATNKNTMVHPNMMSQTNYINPVYASTLGNSILTDGDTVTVRATKKLITKERGNRRSRK